MFYWIAGVALAGGILAAFIGVAYTSWTVLVGGLLAIIVAVLFLYAEKQLIAGTDEHAAYAITLAIFLGAAAYTIVLPGAGLTLALLPVIVLAIVLPLVRGRALKRIMVGSGVAGLLLIIGNIFWDPTIRFSELFTLGLRAAAFALVLALTMSMLTHHHRRLGSMLEKSRADTEELRLAHDRLKEADATKTRFLNAAAHELRTPLTPVLIQLDVIRHNPAVTNDSKINRSLDVIHRNMMRLKEHVDDLLDIARLQSGRYNLKLEDVALGPLLQDVDDSFRELAKEKKVRLQSRPIPDVRVRADPRRLLQVMFNLYSNALKATSQGGQVLVEVNREGPNCTIYVVDDGVGIAKKDLDRLFQPFEQLDEEEPNAGAGLGLFISRTIIEAHGGTIGAHSDGRGKGATFYVTLPLAETAAWDRQTLQRPEKSQPQMHGPLYPPASQTP